MKNLITGIFLFIAISSFSQNRSNIEADYEIHGYFKNYQEFDIDTLKKKKFKHIRTINSTIGGFEFERMLDNNLKQSIYTITADLPIKGRTYYKKYSVSVFSKSDSIIGLITYNVYTGSVNSYFDYKKLDVHIELHNKFYETKLRISDFVDQLKKMETYGYSCDYAPISNAPLVYKDVYFDNIRNGKYFRNWLTSFSPELQSFGVDALEYLEEKYKLPLSPNEKKIITHVKTRNSKLQACSGCVTFPRKVYD